MIPRWRTTLWMPSTSSSRLLRRALATRPLLDMLELPPTTPLSEVRAKYLQAALHTHPDHSANPDAGEKMAELQNAWIAYKSSLRSGKLLGGGFTKFGVGCSFDDSEEERRDRAELMEMASRGVMNPRTLSTRSK